MTSFQALPVSLSARTYLSISVEASIFSQMAYIIEDIVSRTFLNISTAIALSNTSKEMIQELHSMFGEYDQLATCNAMLHDPAFGMGVSKENRKEIVDHFYARFSATITPLSYSESNRIAALKRLITTKLQLRIAGMVTSAASFRAFVEHL